MSGKPTSNKVIEDGNRHSVPHFTMFLAVDQASTHCKVRKGASAATGLASWHRPLVPVEFVNSREECIFRNTPGLVVSTNSHTSYEEPGSAIVG